MRRRTFDVIASCVGLLLTVMLDVAGALGAWASSYTSSQVHNQLAAQQIVFPTTGSASFKALPASDQKAVAPYAGQRLLTGKQAETFADHYIAYHLSEMPMHGVYAKISAAAMAAPKASAQAAKLQAEEATIFQGTSLQGMLLEAYAFGTMGTIAGPAAAAFAGAAVMVLLSALGLLHSRRVTAEAQLRA